MVGIRWPLTGFTSAFLGLFSTDRKCAATSLINNLTPWVTLEINWPVEAGPGVIVPSLLEHRIASVGLVYGPVIVWLANSDGRSP